MQLKKGLARTAPLRFGELPHGAAALSFREVGDVRKAVIPWCI